MLDLGTRAGIYADEREAAGDTEGGALVRELCGVIAKTANRTATLENALKDLAGRAHAALSK